MIMIVIMIVIVIVNAIVIVDAINIAIDMMTNEARMRCGGCL